MFCCKNQFAINLRYSKQTEILIILINLSQEQVCSNFGVFFFIVYLLCGVFIKWMPKFIPTSFIKPKKPLTRGSALHLMGSLLHSPRLFLVCKIYYTNCTQILTKYGIPKKSRYGTVIWTFDSLYCLSSNLCILICSFSNLLPCKIIT